MADEQPGRPLAFTLVEAAQSGDTLAMAELLELLTPYVARLCGPIALGNAPDAAQEALIAIMKGLRGLRDPQALFGWVRMIAVRESVRVARTAVRLVVVEPEQLSRIPEASDPELQADVRSVLRRLSPEHRAVLVLRDLEGFDEAAAAALLDVPPGTVKSRLHRARAHFRKEWTR